MCIYNCTSSAHFNVQWWFVLYTCKKKFQTKYLLQCTASPFNQNKYLVNNFNPSRLHHRYNNTYLIKRSYFQYYKCFIFLEERQIYNEAYEQMPISQRTDVVELRFEDYLECKSQHSFRTIIKYNCLTFQYIILRSLILCWPK